MADGNEKQLERFKTSSVSNLTGFSPSVLRAWERRYDFLRPERLPGGHRIYTPEDLRILLRIKELTAQGYSVGEIAEHGRQWLLGAGTRAEQQRGWIAEAARLVGSSLESYRVDRYRGEGLGVSLSELEPFDLAAVVTLYEKVSSVYHLWRYMDQPARDEDLLWRKIESALDQELHERIVRLGSAAPSHDKLLRAAIEDAKHGALAPLKRMLSGSFEKNEDKLKRAVLLCRDHAKMLRNAFTDLDASIRTADESFKIHSIVSTVGKLEGFPLPVETHLDFHGAISSRCLETSALDRILYSFLRKLQKINVQQVKLWVGESGNQLVRLAFHHKVDSPIIFHNDELAALAVGLSVGLTGTAALEQGFLGSKNYWAWFHWPLLVPSPDSHICDCEI